MADTIRELIIQELIARAAVIVTTGSPQAYSTDIGTNVFRVRQKVDPSELPCLNIRPQPEEAETTHGKVKHKMPVRIEGIMAFGSSSPSVVAEKMLGDLIKCFTSPSWDRRHIAASPASPVTYLDPYIESIVYEGGGTDEYPEDGTLTIGASVSLKITYWTAIGDPFTP